MVGSPVHTLDFGADIMVRAVLYNGVASVLKTHLRCTLPSPMVPATPHRRMSAGTRHGPCWPGPSSVAACTCTPFQRRAYPP